MYEFIEGTIIELTPAAVIVKTGGIGYFVNISLHTFSSFSTLYKLHPSELYKIYLHQIVREDAILLFGFFSAKERAIFRLLISVSGVGANTARMILSSLNPDELSNAIAGGNVNALKAIKGIGLKTAQRMIIDLKDKIGLESNLNDNFIFQNNTIKEEALSALVTLGFAKSSVEKLLDKFLIMKPDVTVEELIKQTLKNI